MSEEIKFEHQNECFCKSKGFRRFLTVASGTFVGVFCALSLFCALHRPPVMFHPPFMGPMGPYMNGAEFYAQKAHCMHHKKMYKKFMHMQEKFQKEMKNSSNEDND